MLDQTVALKQAGRVFQTLILWAFLKPGEKIKSFLGQSKERWRKNQAFCFLKNQTDGYFEDP